MTTVTPFTRPNVRMVDGEPRTSSRDVADYFGRQHRNVLQAIERLECSEDFRLLNFQQTPYFDEQGREQPGYEMTKDGFVFLAMGFTGKKAAEFKERYIRAFNDMESKLASQQQLPADVVQLLGDLNEAMRGEDRKLVPTGTLRTLFSTVDEQTSAIRQQLDDLDSALGYIRESLEERVGSLR